MVFRYSLSLGSSLSNSSRSYATHKDRRTQGAFILRRLHQSLVVDGTRPSNLLLEISISSEACTLLEQPVWTPHAVVMCCLRKTFLWQHFFSAVHLRQHIVSLCFSSTMLLDSHQIQELYLVLSFLVIKPKKMYYFVLVWCCHDVQIQTVYSHLCDNIWDCVTFWGCLKPFSTTVKLKGVYWREIKDELYDDRNNMILILQVKSISICRKSTLKHLNFWTVVQNDSLLSYVIFTLSSIKHYLHYECLLKLFMWFILYVLNFNIN